MNNVILSGRLTRDIDFKFTAGEGKPVARFTLAVDRKFKKDEADFINCVSFGKTAETMTQYLTKGNKIAVTGSIRTGRYTDGTGNTRYSTSVYVDSFEFLEKSDRTQSDTNYNISLDDDITPVNDGDMPF